MMQKQPITISSPIPSLRSKPQLFTIEYDHSKVKSKNPWTNREKHRKTMQWGTCYPNGMVTLDNGVCFMSKHQMEMHFEEQGIYHIEDEVAT